MSAATGRARADCGTGHLIRVALDAAEAMPAHLIPHVGRTSTVTSQFVRAGYASPKQILDAVRLAMALHQLDVGATIAEVTYWLGYSSQQSFSRTFRRLTGRTTRTRAGLDGAAIIRAAFRPTTQRELVLP